MKKEKSVRDILPLEAIGQVVFDRRTGIYSNPSRCRWEAWAYGPKTAVLIGWLTFEVPDSTYQIWQERVWADLMLGHLPEQTGKVE